MLAISFSTLVVRIEVANRRAKMLAVVRVSHSQVSVNSVKGYQVLSNRELILDAILLAHFLHDVNRKKKFPSIRHK